MITIMMMMMIMAIPTTGGAESCDDLLDEVDQS